MKKILIALGILLSFIFAGCSRGDGGNDAITGTPLWNAGIGVIIQSTTSFLPMSATAGDSSSSGKDSFAFVEERGVKQWLATQIYHSFTPAARSFNAISDSTTLSSIDDNDWANSVKYIFLDWQPLNGATYYQVYFLGKDGTASRVWNSQENHPNDPTYATKAFLDITEELAGIVREAGQYRFKVIAYNGGSSKEYPAITVSIGRLLGTYLRESDIHVSGSQLSWPAIDGASGYKAAVYKDAALTKVAWNSGKVLLQDTFADFGDLSGGDYYAVAFADADDETGRTLEITYATSVFTVK